jgi:hypothetical protein
MRKTAIMCLFGTAAIAAMLIFLPASGVANDDEIEVEVKRVKTPHAWSQAVWKRGDGSWQNLTEGQILKTCDWIKVSHGYVKVRRYTCPNKETWKDTRYKLPISTGRFHISKEEVNKNGALPGGYVDVYSGTTRTVDGPGCSGGGHCGKRGIQGIGAPIDDAGVTDYICIQDSAGSTTTFYNHPLSSGRLGTCALVGPDTQTVHILNPCEAIRYDSTGETTIPQVGLFTDRQDGFIVVQYNSTFLFQLYVCNPDTQSHTISLAASMVNPTGWNVDPEISQVSIAPQSYTLVNVNVETGSTYGEMNVVDILAHSESGDTVGTSFYLEVISGVTDNILVSQDLTFAWYRDGQMLEDIEWDYDFAVFGDMNPTRQTQTGLLNFREMYPEYNDYALSFMFYPPPEANGWRQTIIDANGVSDVYAYNITGVPADINWSVPDLLPASPNNFDTIYTAIDLSFYCLNNPGGFANGEWENGQNLNDLQIAIVDGQTDGCEGIFWAVSEFEIGGDRDIPSPVGGEKDLLNTFEYPTDLLIAAAHANRLPDWLSGCCDVPGDANNDGEANIGDIVVAINYVFRSGQAPSCFNKGDVNHNCIYDVGDAVYLVNYVFKGGPAPTCGCVD